MGASGLTSSHQAASATSLGLAFIFNVPILTQFGAADGFRNFKTPVETSTSPGFKSMLSHGDQGLPGNNPSTPVRISLHPP